MTTKIRRQEGTATGAQDGADSVQKSIKLYKNIYIRNKVKNYTLTLLELELLPTKGFTLRSVAWSRLVAIRSERLRDTANVSESGSCESSSRTPSTVALVSLVKVGVGLSLFDSDFAFSRAVLALFTLDFELPALPIDLSLGADSDPRRDVEGPD